MISHQKADAKTVSTSLRFSYTLNDNRQCSKRNEDEERRSARKKHPLVNFVQFKAQAIFAASGEMFFVYRLEQTPTHTVL